MSHQRPVTLGALRCPICQTPLAVRLAQARRSGKFFLLLVCPRDGRPFRGFIAHKPFVQEVMNRLQKEKEEQPVKTAPCRPVKRSFTGGNPA